MAISVVITDRRFRRLWPDMYDRLLIASEILLDIGSRSYVSGLLIDTRVVALLGLRTRRGLITGQVDYDHLGRQTLGA